MCIMFMFSTMYMRICSDMLLGIAACLFEDGNCTILFTVERRVPVATYNGKSFAVMCLIECALVDWQKHF